ncbi:MAG: 3-hydroxyacyl-CoA dehydrogenase family protein [Vicinamibacterales bacterium]
MHIQHVGIIGAGVMGAQIAQVVAQGGHIVHLFDISASQLETALHRIQHGRFGLRRGVARGKITEQDLHATLERIIPVTAIEAVCADADLIIEAVPEEIMLKIRVFRRLDALCPEQTILTSNTSGLSVGALAAATDRPERVLGWHWFQPCAVMKLAEIVVHDETSDEARDAVVACAERSGRTVVVVKDQQRVWGFVGNRINRAVRIEAARIVEEGLATREQVDTIMREGFRWPMGPFELQGDGSLS